MTGIAHRAILKPNGSFSHITNLFTIAMATRGCMATINILTHSENAPSKWILLTTVQSELKYSDF